MPKIAELGPLELEVMQIVWERGASTVRDVIGALNTEGRKLAYTTIQTIMTRLEEKGFLAHKAEGVSYRYTAKISKKRVQHSLLSRFVDQVFDGAVGPLVASLAESKKLTAEDIEQLRKVLQTMKDELRIKN